MCVIVLRSQVLKTMRTIKYKQVVQGNPRVGVVCDTLVGASGGEGGTEYKQDNPSG